LGFWGLFKILNWNGTFLSESQNSISKVKFHGEKNNGAGVD
jgi:hypothetical protein